MRHGFATDVRSVRICQRTCCRPRVGISRVHAVRICSERTSGKDGLQSAPNRGRAISQDEQRMPLLVQTMNGRSKFLWRMTRTKRCDGVLRHPQLINRVRTSTNSATHACSHLLEVFALRGVLRRRRAHDTDVEAFSSIGKLHGTQQTAPVRTIGRLRPIVCTGVVCLSKRGFGIKIYCSTYGLNQPRSPSERSNAKGG